MNRLLLIACFSALTLAGQTAKWWAYDATAPGASCQIVSGAAGLYKQMSAKGVSAADLKSKFPNVAWSSGKIAAAIVSTARDGDLVQSSLAVTSGNVHFRLVRDPVVRLSNAPSRLFVVEIEKSKAGANPSCTWSVSVAGGAAQSPVKVTVRQ